MAKTHSSKDTEIYIKYSMIVLPEELSLHLNLTRNAVQHNKAVRIILTPFEDILLQYSPDFPSLTFFIPLYRLLVKWGRKRENTHRHRSKTMKENLDIRYRKQQEDNNLHSAGLSYLYTSHYIVKVIKSLSVRRVGHLA